MALLSRGVTILVVVAKLAAAWYLPGSTPEEFHVGDRVTIKVNSLRSVKTQTPLRFYDLPFCRPPLIRPYHENLGEVLSGDLIENSPYLVNMQEDKFCALLCKIEKSDPIREELINAIDDRYAIQLLVDNLPAVMMVHTQMGLSLVDDQSISYMIGYPVGVVRGASHPLRHELYNHVTLQLKYHKRDNGNVYRIVGFAVIPRSIEHQYDQERLTCEATSPLILETAQSIHFTYDVSWIESSIKWATRWDVYFQAGKGENEIHWFSIVNSLMIVLFLTGVVAIILLRTLLRDIARYNSLDNVEEAQEESGWKLVHGDVFRKPAWSRLLATCAGTGVQILVMTIIVIFFAMLGFLSPANRGALLQSMILLFTMMGFLAGFVAARFSKLFEGVSIETRHRLQSLQVTCLTAFLYPGICFGVFFIVNLILWHRRSTGAVPFATMFLLLLLWFGISTPLVFVGAHFGLKKEPISLPVKCNSIPREIPPGGCLTNRYVVCLVGGILPFGAVFTELLFMLGSIWQHQFYSFFGFVALVLIILLVTCGEISIAFTYFHLAAEDYHWWWRSFWLSGTSGLYVFLYCALFFFTRSEISSFAPAVLFFGYSFLLSYSFCLLTGATGFLSTFFFLRAIYGSIKID